MYTMCINTYTAIQVRDHFSIHFCCRSEMGSQKTEAKKAMKAAKTRRAMKKNKVKRIREKPKCRCSGCESCNSRAPCKISLYSGGLCSGCILKKGTPGPTPSELAQKSKRNRLQDKRYIRKQPPRVEAPSCQRDEKGGQGSCQAVAVSCPAEAAVASAMAASEPQQGVERLDLTILSLTKEQVNKIKALVKKFKLSQE